MTASNRTSGQTAGRFVGQAVNRKEDPRLLTGRGTYVDDVVVNGMLHAAFVRSNVAHGRIVSIDADAAREVEGVVAVLTGADLNPGRGSMHPTIQLEDPANTDVKPLADDRVLFVGDPVALVVAETRAIAEDAAELVEVDVEPLDAVVGYDAALEDGTIVHPEKGSNVGSDMPVIIPGWDEIKAGAAHVVEATFHQHRQTNVPMETRGIIAQYEPATGELRVWLSTQNPHEARAAISRSSGVPMHQVRVSAKDVGGGFGQKMFLFRDEQTIASAAVHLGRTIKWIEDRRENLIASNHARADRATVELALDAEGHLLGAWIDEVEDSGSWPLGAMGGAAGAVGAFFSGPYRLPFVSWHARSVWTNTCQRAAYRGPWMMETTAREEMVEYAARAIGIDPLELRRRNVIHKSDLPYTTPMFQTYDDSISPEETLEQAVSVIGYDDFRAEQRRAFETDGRLLGIGLSLYVEPCAMGAMDPLSTETASIKVLPTGKVNVAIGTGNHGQGLETTFAQVVAEELGIDYDDVVVVQGDTEVLPFGRGTGGSGSAIIGANACRLAAESIRDKAFQIAAQLMEASPGDLELQAPGKIAVKGTPSRTIDFAEVARVAYLETAKLPEGMEPSLEATHTYKAPPVTYANACHACTVEVDRNTGRVEILRYVVSEDCGAMINPKIVDGQIAGGVVQGIGGVLFEHVVYDDDGNPLTTTFMDYLLPTAAEIPEIEIHHIETRAPNPGGHKGVGEGGAIGSPACVFNAVADALALLGITITDQPLGPRQVLDALMAAGY